MIQKTCLNLSLPHGCVCVCVCRICPAKSLLTPEKQYQLSSKFMIFGIICRMSANYLIDLRLNFNEAIKKARKC